MLYVTTRDRHDAHTSYKTLCADTAPDGGLYVPYILPQLDAQDLLRMRDQSFGENVSKILNLFFSAKLSGWDVDFCVGRNPIKTAAVGRKVIVAELWRNPGADYSYFTRNIYARLCDKSLAVPTNWAKVAVRIAVLFATYMAITQSAQNESNKIDVSIPVGDLTDAVAAFYARKMGLPIENIIMCTSDNSALWDLLNRGEISTALMDTNRKLGLERLIETICDTAEVARYKAACDKHGLYILPDTHGACFSNGLFAAVVGKDRIGSVINSVYRNYGYFIDPHTAVCLGGLQDYRAKTGESRVTLLFSDQSPAAFQDDIQKATGVTQEFVSALKKKG